MKVRSTDLILVAIASGLLLSFVLALKIVPRLFPPDPNLPSAAAQLGYNIPLAYWLFAAIAGGGGLLVALLGRASPSSPVVQASAPVTRSRLLWLERFGVLGFVAVLYWPPALARFGPHTEADYFINVLWRIVCGQAPYTDFEFLYGPLMIGLAEAWIAVAGYSMVGYYTYYFILQLLFFGTLLLLLQAYVQTPWKRYAAFLLLLPFAFDTLFGLNWMPWRYFLAPLAILAAAALPKNTMRALLAGAIVGAQLALSHEYGIAALLAVLSIYAVQVFYPGRGRAVLNGIAFVLTSVAAWALLAFAMTGAAFGDYIMMMYEVSTRSGSLGLGQFAFDWTVHSAALFLVLCCVLALFSGSLRQLGRKPLATGDLHLIAASVFLAVAMRVALQRVGYQHMAVPFLPLILVLLLNRPRSLLWNNALLSKVALAGAAVAAFAQAAGHSHLARWQLQNQARGIVHELRGEATTGPIAARGQTTQAERYIRDPDIIAIAARLAEPDMKDRPVLFYLSSWDWAALTGVCPAGYSFYDLLYANHRHPHAELLEANPDLAVVIKRRDYDRLRRDEPPPAALREYADYRTVLTWLTTPYYPQSAYENRIEYRMWRDSIGATLVQRFEPAFEGDIGIILVQKP
jgi:hypothetical protein